MGANTSNLEIGLERPNAPWYLACLYGTYLSGFPKCFIDHFNRTYL